MGFRAEGRQSAIRRRLPQNTSMIPNSPRKLSADALKVVPWKNGGGVTTEIAAGPPRSDDQDWSWRVSIADVPATGPFSLFPGIDRTIAVIQGSGMDLHVEDGRVVPLELNRPVDFDGGLAVDGILRDDPIRDFNVMVDRRHFRAALEIREGFVDVQRQVGEGSVLLVHFLDREGSVTGPDGIAIAIKQNETMIYEGAVSVSVSIGSGARAAIVVLEQINGEV